MTTSNESKPAMRKITWAIACIGALLGALTGMVMNHSHQIETAQARARIETAIEQWIERHADATSGVEIERALRDLESARQRGIWTGMTAQIETVRAHLRFAAATRTTRKTHTERSADRSGHARAFASLGTANETRNGPQGQTIKPAQIVITGALSALAGMVIAPILATLVALAVCLTSLAYQTAERRRHQHKGERPGT